MSCCCPMCSESHNVVNRVRVHTITANGQKYDVDLNHYFCTSCKVYFVDALMRREEYFKIRDFRRSIPNYIHPDDILSIREKMNVTSEYMAHVFDIPVHEYNNWETGIDTPSSKHIELLKLMVEELLCK